MRAKLTNFNNILAVEVSEFDVLSLKLYAQTSGYNVTRLVLVTQQSPIIDERLKITRQR